MYLKDAGGEDKCPTCNGFHTLPCRENERAQVIQPVFARYRRRTEEWLQRKEEIETGSESETETEREVAPEPLQPQQHFYQHLSHSLIAYCKQGHTRE